MIREATRETRHEFHGAIIAGLVRSILEIGEHLPDREEMKSGAGIDNFYAAVTGAVARAYQLRRWAEKGKNPFGYLDPLFGGPGDGTEER